MWVRNRIKSGLMLSQIAALHKRSMEEVSIKREELGLDPGSIAKAEGFKHPNRYVYHQDGTRTIEKFTHPGDSATKIDLNKRGCAPQRNGQMWSKDEENVLRAMYMDPLYSQIQIAEHLQRYSNAINIRLHKLGLIS